MFEQAKDVTILDDGTVIVSEHDNEAEASYFAGDPLITIEQMMYNEYSYDQDDEQPIEVE